MGDTQSFEVFVVHALDQGEGGSKKFGIHNFYHPVALLPIIDDRSNIAD